MTDLIEIEGNVVRHIQRVVVAESSVAQFAPLIERRVPTIFPVQPNNAIISAFDPDEKRGVVFVERVPERVTMNVHFDVGLRGNTHRDDFNKAAETNNRTTFAIQLPYLYFVFGFKVDTRTVGDHVGMANFTLDRTTLWWRPEPIRKMSDRIWPAAVPNVEAARICWGYPTWDNTDTMAMRINQMVNEFPITQFTNHYGMPLPAEYRSYIEWEKASEQNPLIYRDWRQFKDNAGSKEVSAYALTAMQNGTGIDYGTMPLPEDMTTVLIPEPPAQFTIGRLRDWIATIPEPLRARFIAEAGRIAQEIDDG